MCHFRVGLLSRAVTEGRLIGGEDPGSTRAGGRRGNVGVLTRLSVAKMETTFVLGFMLLVHEVALDMRDSTDKEVQGLVWRISRSHP